MLANGKFTKEEKQQYVTGKRGALQRLHQRRKATSILLSMIPVYTGIFCVSERAEREVGDLSR